MPDHAVFELVPPTFHEHADNFYAAIGRPEIMTKTFWDIYLNLLKWLHDGRDKELTDILSSHQPSAQPVQEDMALLPDMAPFYLGHPIDVGTNTNYIGRLDVSAPLSSIPALHPSMPTLHLTRMMRMVWIWMMTVNRLIK